jgi:hypothetical protein
MLEVASMKPKFQLFLVTLIVLAACSAHENQVLPPVAAGGNPGTLSRPDIPQPDNTAQFIAVGQGDVTTSTKRGVATGSEVVFSDELNDFLYLVSDLTGIVLKQPVPTQYMENGHVHTAITPTNLTVDPATGKVAFAYEQGDPTIGVYDPVANTFNLFLVLATAQGGLTFGGSNTVAFGDVNANLEKLDLTTGVATVIDNDPPGYLPSCVQSTYDKLGRFREYDQTMNKYPDGTEIDSVTAGGTVTRRHIPAPPGYSAFGSAIVADKNGNVYLPIVDAIGSPTKYNVTKMSPSGTFTQYPAPQSILYYCQSVTLAQNQTLWFGGSNGQLVDFSLATHSAHIFSMPSQFSFPALDAVAFGADGNVYASGGTFNGTPALAVFLNERLKVVPSKISTTLGNSVTVYVGMTHYNRTFSAKSLDTSICTVAPGADKNHFVVTPVSKGKTSIEFAAQGNTIDIPAEVL